MAGEIDKLSSPVTVTAPRTDELDALSSPTGTTTLEKAKEVLTGTAEGAATTGPIVAGGMAGARIGMTAAAPFSAVFPAAIPVGGTIGLGAGMAAGYLSGREFGKMFPETRVPELVPYREGGKTFGESIAFAPAAFGLPVMTGNKVARFVSNIGDFARKYPKTFLSAEVSGATGAGVAGGV
jgi:hypothetical protein